MIFSQGEGMRSGTIQWTG